MISIDFKNSNLDSNLATVPEEILKDRVRHSKKLPTKLIVMAHGRWCAYQQRKPFLI
jgi:hypothetical protein